MASEGRAGMTHNLKTWPHEFDATRKELKTFEVRSNTDRSFGVGDILLLRKWDPADHGITKRHGAYISRTGWPDSDVNKADTISMRVTYILHGGRFGLPDGVCVMGIEPTTDPQERTDGE